MAYVQFDATKPNGATANGTTVLSELRDNMEALRDMVVAGTLYGWACTASGGTADMPTTMLHSKGTERLRETITWGSTGGATNNPQTILYSYSSNSGSSYDAIGTITYTYDASGNVTSWAWS